jgi:GTP-binding protein
MDLNLDIPPPAAPARPATKPEQRIPRVALVGRTNVGKSSLWNRFTESGHALVSEDAHTTRDRKHGFVLWQGREFTCVDTGGMDTEKNSVGDSIKTQSLNAIEDADLVLFVVDGKTGPLPQDRELAEFVRAHHKKDVWLLVNKVDTMKDFGSSADQGFLALHLSRIYPISANTGLGVGDVLDEICKELEARGVPPVDAKRMERLKIAIVGRPNVGKSSIVNAILGEDRVIISPIAHTTREPQDTELEFQGHKITIIDTAGMRRNASLRTEIEEAGVQRNMGAIDACDVAFLVFDASEDPTSQDRALAGYLAERAKGVILVANKWDLIPAKDTHTSEKFEVLVRSLFPFLNWAPMIFVSALKRQRMTTLLEHALKIQVERKRHIEYNALNRLLKTCIKTMKPLTSYGPKSPRIYDVAQVDHEPPTFLMTVHGEKDSIHNNWLKFFEKRLRNKFEFTGTPIITKVRNLPVAKSQKSRNIFGPGMEAVAGKIREKPVLVNQTRRRQKYQ